MAQIHKGGLFQIHGLFSVHKRGISVIQHVHKLRANNDRAQVQHTLIHAELQSTDLNKPPL